MCPGQNVPGANCPRGKLSMGQNVMGRAVHWARSHGASCNGVNCPGIFKSAPALKESVPPSRVPSHGILSEFKCLAKLKIIFTQKGSKLLYASGDQMLSFGEKNQM
jgi:hypothetical protein